MNVIVQMEPLKIILHVRHASQHVKLVTILVHVLSVDFQIIGNCLVHHHH